VRTSCLLRLFTLLALSATSFVARGEDLPFNRKQDVIYARKFGTALTMDVFQPKEKANGIGIVFVVSGGWFSGHDASGHLPRIKFLLDSGYTVFPVVHGSQPKFSIPEILEDMNRAVRFIRFHAKDYGIDPNRIGVTGASAGGHLSLMLGTAGKEGNPNAKDPIDREPSRVQAVAGFFPPTDFLDYGKPGENAIGRGILWNYAGAFDFKDFDPYARRFVPVTDEEKITKIGREISPVNHVSADDPPTLLIHGDKDWLVPIQQSEIMIEKFKQAGVEAKLIVKAGAEHGWADMGPDLAAIVDWFDVHLKGATAAGGK
jgi:acetyl esterase/lipase